MGTLLRGWRRRALLTQEQLAERCGLSVRTIRRLESDSMRHAPQSASLQLLATALDLDATEKAHLVSVAHGEPVRPNHEESSRAGGGEHAAVPRQLPAHVDGFVGRTTELCALDHLLDAHLAPDSRSMTICAITGAPGVGKTTLAVHWAHLAAQHFPDGQLYVDLRGYHASGSVVEPDEAVRGFLDALGIPPAGVPATFEAQAALYRSVLADKRMLVVLDNARSAEQVRPLLPGSATCLVVTTSRDQLTSLVAVNSARPLVLDLLAPAEARELLTRRIDVGKLAIEADAADEIIAACGRLPLALAVAAARAATTPHLTLSTLATQLREEQSGLDALTIGDPVTDARIVFSWSYHALSTGAARLFRLLGHHYGPSFTVPAAASLAALPLPAARSLVAELCRAHLLIEHSPDRYTFHDLLRAYAAELGLAEDGEQELRSALRRALHRDLHMAHVAARLLSPDREQIDVAPPPPGVVLEEIADRERAMEWFTEEHPTLVAAVARAATSRFDSAAWQLAWTLADFLNWRGYWNEWRATHVIALEAARRQEDLSGQAHTHRGIAGANLYLGRVDDAVDHVRSALALYEQLGDQVGQARAHYNLSRLFGTQRQHVDALHHATRALGLYEACGNRAGQARALNAIGWDEAQLGDFRHALAHAQESLTLYQQIGHHIGEATAWDTVGYAHQRLGEPDRALTCYRRAVVLLRNVGNRFLEAFTLTNIGDAHLAAGATDDARDAWTEALAILVDLGHPDADAVRAKLRAPTTVTS